jgi:hypothetical protein
MNYREIGLAVLEGISLPKRIVTDPVGDISLSIGLSSERDRPLIPLTKMLNEIELFRS